jgi:hypothetical protein
VFQGVINIFEIWSWKGMLKIKRTGRIKTDECFSKCERRKTNFKNLKKMGTEKIT